MSRASSLPATAGVGFKPQHFVEISETPQPIGFFEIHAENYMGAGGRPHAQLAFLREHYALSVHGVGLSLGSRDPLDKVHLARLRTLCDRYHPESVSEHIAWSRHDGLFLDDLLPLPYNAATLATLIHHVDEAQAALGRRFLLENPATYVRFAESTIPEPEFLAEIVRATGCGLLLDVNNVFVSSRNHATDARAYLVAFPLEHVEEIHLAGHFVTRDSAGSPLLVDAHGSPVISRVFDLFDEVIARVGRLPTLIEWDNDVPDWPSLLAEAQRAQARLQRHLRESPQDHTRPEDETRHGHGSVICAG